MSVGQEAHHQLIDVLWTLEPEDETHRSRDHPCGDHGAEVESGACPKRCLNGNTLVLWQHCNHITQSAPSVAEPESPMSYQPLGEFEQMVLLAILQLEGDVYGVPVVDEIERRTGRSVSRSAVYVTLRRLEQKGLVSSWMSDPTPERGGKPRRCVKVEPQGLRLLRESRRAMDGMWKGLDPALEDVR
jgi:DNA-binding PadR family transcriptional regulator